MASQKSYLQWLAEDTVTNWWHDSADLDELAFGMEHGAVGATVNPVLVSKAVKAHAEKWRQVAESLASTDDDERIEEIARQVTCAVAEKLLQRDLPDAAVELVPGLEFFHLCAHWASFMLRVRQSEYGDPGTRRQSRRRG